MGDRGNVYIVQREEFDRGIYLYTHWEGSILPQMLADALEVARPRWDDESYGTRILVDQIFKSHRDDETGAGISTYLTDNEYPILVVDFENQQVYEVRQGLEQTSPNSEEFPRSEVDFYSFEEWATTVHEEREYGDW